MLPGVSPLLHRQTEQEVLAPTPGVPGGLGGW